jgi:hypothetical protein
MASTAVRTGDSVLRACANLKALRDNLPSRFVFQEGLYKMFDSALDELQRAGVDVSEWRLPPNAAVDNIHSNEFRAKIDAILLYFTIKQEKMPIGFRT